jgi:hypothetical protein
VERHRIGLEVEVDRGRFELEPSEWDLDDLMTALREGAARMRRVVMGRVIDEQHDLLSETLQGMAQDLDHALELHWMVSASSDAMIQPVPGSPRPSLESLVELRELADQARRVAERLRQERL